MDASHAMTIAAALDRIADATRSCAHGGVSGPAGLEGIAMSLMDGIDSKPGVAAAIYEVAGAINNVSVSLDGIAAAIKASR